MDWLRMSERRAEQASTGIFEAWVLCWCLVIAISYRTGGNSPSWKLIIWVPDVGTNEVL